MDKSQKHHCQFSLYLQSKTKRFFDLFVAFFMLIFGLPLMFLTGVAIWVSSGRPILFIQWRIGKDRMPFRMIKFRTLHQAANPYETSPCQTNDSRITSLGRFLRHFRLDELPQLICVLSGQMTMVGPRPELPNIVATYTSYHTQRLITKPGLTGLWQIKGNRSFPIHHDMKYDLYYLHNASLWLDSKLLFMTVGFLLGCKYKHNNYENSVCPDNLSLPN